ncbi:UDP-N-acetylmuramoyl-L-alanyl-D-glutamate--2,6-diaminopimelate ligase [Thalassotalea aquiviva]|uniref:UDP-N-acetylmuramoyl-L-alanyl-D-glutamate--2, 6-diaminopimelate ligase n=1 Tax=Thalassotalea aquiviva TaxID=3242415 RepID=UPI00352BC7CD
MLNPLAYEAFSIAQALSHFGINIDPIATKKLVNDSRLVEPDDIFAAVQGSALNGQQFIDMAITNGAALVIAQCEHKSQHGQISTIALGATSVQVIAFYQLAEQLKDLSALYYNQPKQSLKVYGITGTNGKTTCSQLIAQLFEAQHQPSAIIGTLGAGRLGQLIDINNTTPGPTTLQHLFAGFVHDNIEHVAMEVSSHALSQSRVDSKMVDVAVFTNLSRDHLDFHGSMQAYQLAKRRLFEGNKQQTWVLNADDPVSHQYVSQLPSGNPTVLFSVEPDFDVPANQQYLHARDILCHNRGVRFSLDTSWGQAQIDSNLLGVFNVSNLLAALAVLLVQGIELKSLIKHCSNLLAVPGRMEAFTGVNQATAVVDYAHTPDGLEKALESVKQHCLGNVWLVFGCGGDRDPGKRAIMGSIAVQHADHVILTNDNPRTEEPQHIVNDILAGIHKTKHQQARVKVILDRQQAVLHALAQAKENDMVLCAGKGHEDYTIIGNQKLPYEERELVRKYYLGEAS